MTTIVRPAVEEPIRAKGLDRAFIRALVCDFYRRVRADGRLGPIFSRHVAGDWEPHLQKMTDFWCSVMLKDRSYDGRPVPAHLKLKEVEEGDFAIWLDLFRKTARDHCSKEVSDAFIERAERIAESLKLAMFFRLPKAPSVNDGGSS